MRSSADRRPGWDTADQFGKLGVEGAAIGEPLARRQVFRSVHNSSVAIQSRASNPSAFHERPRSTMVTKAPGPSQATSRKGIRSGGRRDGGDDDVHALDRLTRLIDDARHQALGGGGEGGGRCRGLG